MYVVRILLTAQKNEKQYKFIFGTVSFHLNAEIPAPTYFKVS
jgi:hypothetical protein